MSETITSAIITALPPTLMAAVVFWQGRRSQKEFKSRLSEWWKEETAKAALLNAASKAEGVKEGSEHGGTD